MNADGLLGLNLIGIRVPAAIRFSQFGLLPREARSKMRSNPLYSKVADPSTVRIITYNLHKGKGAANRDSIPDAADALAAREPSVLMCQEVFHGKVDSVKQCDHIADALAHDHAFGPNAFYQRGCHGNATFSQFTVENHENHDITHWRLEKRGILQTFLRHQDTAFVAYNVHFSLTAGQRRKQWMKLLELLEQEPDIPAIVCGDFNDWSGEIDRLALNSLHLESVQQHLSPQQRKTFPARRPLLGLDRIYFRGLKCLSARVLRGEPWNRLSDHLPLEADFQPL